MKLYILLVMLLSSLVSIGAVRWIYFRILKIAKEKNLVDNPDARKLQKEPVPVVGGLAVFFGLIFGLLAGSAFYALFASFFPWSPVGVSLHDILPIVLGMSIMLFTGCLDDISGLSPLSRLIIEIFVLLCMIFSTGIGVDSLHGMWGIYELPAYVSIPLTVFAGVGIINAINMADGVNGLSSGLCISSCLLCGVHFLNSGHLHNALLSFCMVASLIPFFIHNVFGRTSRMFIGDAGTMMLGILMTWFVINIMHDGVYAYDVNNEICPTAMVLALFAVPVADTLRVMTMRVLKGKSPFSPDKTHLHHAFVALGVSHSATTLSEILIGFGVMTTWIFSVVMGANLEWQLYIIVSVAAVLVWGTYFFLLHEQKSNSRKALWLRHLSFHTHLMRTNWGQRFAQYLDSPEQNELQRKVPREKLKRKFSNY